MGMAEDISEYYEELMTAPDDYDRASKFDRMAAVLPNEAWLR